MTNSWYDESLLYLSAFVGFGGECIPSPTSAESLDRFARLACATHNGDTIDRLNIADAAMQHLDAVLDNTLLSAVFHPSSGDMIFKTSRNAVPRMLRIADFDLSPASSRMMLDIHAVTDAMKSFDSQEMVSSMQEVFSVGGEFLRLHDYQYLMMARQVNPNVA